MESMNEPKENHHETELQWPLSDVSEILNLGP